MPILDKNLKNEAAGALLEVMASIRAGEWLIPTVNTNGEACHAMTTALARKAVPWAFLSEFQRATIEAGCSFDEHMNSHVSPKRRKDLARNRRRLEELGRVEHESHSCGEGLGRAVAAFLEIEASGWKGRRGTALACHENTRLFAENAFTGTQGESICRADVLTFNGAPIAVSLIASAGRTGFTVKCAYDEAYRNYSAGLLLEVEVVRSFLSGDWATRLDSATAGAHVVDSLWPGRIEVADLVFSLSPRYSELRLSALQRTDQLKRSARARLKQLLNRVRKK